MVVLALVFYGACYGKSCISFLLPFFYISWKWLTFYFVIVVWKRQFIYVYGRLYEVNGRRSSIRIQRYSMDALACTSRFLRLCFFFFQLMNETPLIRYPWNMQWLNSFSLHSSFWVSLSESAERGWEIKGGGLMNLYIDKAKGHAIATGVLFALTLISKIM